MALPSVVIKAAMLLFGIGLVVPGKNSGLPRPEKSPASSAELGVVRWVRAWRDRRLRLSWLSRDGLDLRIVSNREPSKACNHRWTQMHTDKSRFHVLCPD